MTLSIDTQKIDKLRQIFQQSVSQRKFCIQTFGCQMNHADSEKIHMLLAQAGLSKVDSWEEADIVIFNTCSVRQKGEDKVFGYVEEIDKLRHQTGRDIKVGLTGCMTRKTGLNKKYYDYKGRKNVTKIELLNLEKITFPVIPESWNASEAAWEMSGIQVNKLSQSEVTRTKWNISDLDSGSPVSLTSSMKTSVRNDGNISLYNSDDELFNRVDTIDFVVRIEEIGSLTTLLSIMYGEDIGQDDNFQSYLRVRQERDTSKSANVIIQTGCDNYCTFCIVPYTRGHEISRPQDEIVQECVEVVERHGAKEVTLLGQNVNSYGKETRQNLWNPEELTWTAPTVRTPFRELLEKLNEIPWLDRIRFTSSNPHDMTRDILDAHFDLDKCCHYLHFALQSGDNDLLKKMNRKHSYDDFKSQVDYLRSRDPLFGISTDIIVGFPGETEEQFENTIKAFQECEFDFAYIARYSPRKQTYAAKMSWQVPADVKAQRWDRLNTLMYQIIQKRNQLMIGLEEVIMVSKIDEETGEISGRTRNFREVYISKNEKIQLGDLIPVKVLELDRWVLKGKSL